MGAWVLGWRSRFLLPTDSLRRSGGGADSVGSGTMPVRVKEWIPDWEKELEVEKLVLAVVLVEQEEGGWLELRARLQ